jgi:hypothetical protein
MRRPPGRSPARACRAEHVASRRRITSGVGPLAAPIRRVSRCVTVPKPAATTPLAPAASPTYGCRVDRGCDAWMDSSRTPGDAFPLPASHCRYDATTGLAIVSQAWVAYVLGRNRTTIREWLDAGRLTCVVTGQSSGSRRVLVDAALASLYRAHQRRAGSAPPPAAATRSSRSTPRPPVPPILAGDRRDQDLVALGALSETPPPSRPGTNGPAADDQPVALTPVPDPAGAGRIGASRRPSRWLAAMVAAAALAASLVFVARLEHAHSLRIAAPALHHIAPARQRPSRVWSPASTAPRLAATPTPSASRRAPRRHAPRRRVRPPAPKRPPAVVSPSGPVTAPPPILPASGQCGFGPCSRF